MSGELKFAFRNLQPISYLKTFNQMIEDNTRQPSKLSGRSQLKTVSLNKFPLPTYYQEMEGIFESASRKKVDLDKSKRSSKQLEEEQFMDNHNSFMRKVLSRFIKHNENRQNIYEQEKLFIKRNDDKIRHKRVFSQPKLEKKKEAKQNSVNPELAPSEHALASKGSTTVQQKEEKNESNGILPQIKQRQNKSKMIFRKDSKITEMLLARKLTTPMSPMSPTLPSKAQVNDEDIDLKEEIINLQLCQVGKQESFAHKVERQIAQFQQQMDIQVHAIKYYNFWNENHQTDCTESLQRSDKKNLENEGRADYSIKFRNYVSK